MRKALPLALALVACGSLEDSAAELLADAGETLQDAAIALQDAAASLADAGKADAQVADASAPAGPRTTSAACDHTLTVTVSGVANSRKFARVRARRDALQSAWVCERATPALACPQGATCSGTTNEAACQQAIDVYEVGGELWIGCYDYTRAEVVTR
jgi:hypothetical protein